MSYHKSKMLIVENIYNTNTDKKGKKAKDN